MEGLGIERYISIACLNRDICLPLRIDCGERDPGSGASRMDYRKPTVLDFSLSYLSGTLASDDEGWVGE